MQEQREQQQAQRRERGNENLPHDHKLVELDKYLRGSSDGRNARSNANTAQKEVENALASVRIEGLEPSAEAKGIFERYVDGDLTLKEMGRAVDQLLDR